MQSLMVCAVLAAAAVLGSGSLLYSRPLGYSGLLAARPLGYSTLVASRPLGYSALVASRPLGYSSLVASRPLGYSVASRPLGYSVAAAVTPVAVGTATVSQSHQQDELGQYAYGYNTGSSAKNEVKTADGVVRGSYSYVDSYGIPQKVSYVADALGFRTVATNLPVAAH
ncbi:Cuticle protein 6 [Amphibalanus amphitrite]|uniref:Cuticle protein 6 n=1 Tax=Amphibalanus amphitrite TaxID=1232801 RepID=A0A6A4X9S2_AMPAM|nr:cuticle protein 7-like [Amphibalanus amphitrite]KAF0312980.1 Cuticle protein 6 [Amphibalanus amphitrite]